MTKKLKPTPAYLSDEEWEALGFQCTNIVVRKSRQEGKSRVTVITAYDRERKALPHFRIKARRKPPYFIIVSGTTVAMDAEGDVWYVSRIIDLRKYGWPRLDEHTRTP